MEQIIKDSLEKSISYSDYRALVRKLVGDKSTTGSEQTEALINYTMLNERRMKRWDKTIKVSKQYQDVIQEYKNKITWLVITESWCGDAAHVMPVMNKFSELNNNIDFHIVLRDDNEALMNKFLTNGSKSIPKLIMVDTDAKEIIDVYGPRPSIATKMVEDFKNEHGALTAEFKEDLQRWYNKDKGQTAITDLIGLLEKQAVNFSL